MRLEEEVVKRSLNLQKPVPTGYTGDFLTLLSKQYPHLLVAGNEQRIKEELGSVNRALVFLKLSRDILAARNRLDDQTKNACPLLSLVDSANSTSAHPKAKEKYSEAYGEPVPAKVNREMLDPLFDKSRVADVIPSSLPLPLDHGTFLKVATADQLFDVLTSIAQPAEDQVESSDLRDFIFASLSMEEEVDFESLARQVFDRYKAYKRTSDAEKGVCERCASPVASKMQPGLNFATSPQAFSQIKPKYQYRAVCPLCGYDNLVVRSGVRGGSSWVYARVETKIPNLLDNLPALESLVARIASGLRSTRKLGKLHEIEGCQNLPFPPRLRIPLRDDDSDAEPARVIRLNDRGILVQLALTDGSRGPKDLRAQFEPVYHVLRYLGLQVALGTEEQDGLFGKPMATIEENYLRSLAVVLLAGQVDKKSNRYVYAAELLERSPSVALAFAAGDGRERFGLKQELLHTFLEYLMRANVPITSKRGGIGMTNLLEDAAFLSPSLVEADKVPAEEVIELEDDEEEPTQAKRKRRGGMWSFCEHRAGDKMTKHSVAKPISQALDELMLGRGVDFAVNKFLQNVNTRIKAENTDDLTAFMAGVRQILERAEAMRQRNITDFLRYKNGLLSAVFMFTRYPDLKSVLTSK
jgi:hypothetical protein